MELSVLTHDDKSCIFGAGLTDIALFPPAAPWGGPWELGRVSAWRLQGSGWVQCGW